MTTITALNVRLGMDVSNFSEGANLAKGEVTKVATIMRQSVPPAEKYKQELDLLNRAFSEAGKQSAQYASAVEFLDKKHQQGKFSADAIAKAQAEVARTEAAATEAAKRQKDETARLVEVEKQRQVILDKGKALTLSVEKAQEAHNRRIREYRELLRAGAIDQETFRRAMERSNKTLKESQTASSSAMSSLKGLAAAYLGVQTISKSINLANKVEDATIAFEVLTGSAKDGALMFENIRKFAADSPVTFSGATEAAKTMMIFNVAAQDVQKNLQMLSDVTGGNNERFKLLSLAFSQTSAAGRLMGGELRQMTEAGFNPLQQISKTTGESMIELKARMEDGGISADEVRQAFEDATAVGGMFHGMTERLAQTVSGKMNIALSDMEQKLADVGEAMGPLITQLLDAFTQIKPLLDPVVNLIAGISEGLGYMVAVLSDVAATIKNVASGDFTLIETASSKFRDDVEARERKAAEAANQQIQHEFGQRLKGVDAIAAAEKKAADKAWQERLKAGDKEFKEKLKEMEALQKAAEEAARKAAEAWQRELEDARKDAMAFFDEQQKKNEQRRADVAKGPGTGMEVGSAESVKFAADAVNAGLAKLAVPEEVVLNRDIAKKTAELLIAQREANAQQARQIQIAERQLKEMEENGFRRLR